MMDENIKEQETNNNGITMQEFLEKCKTGNIDEKDIPEEVMALFEALYAKRKEQEATKNSKDMQAGIMPYVDGLTIDDIKYINEKAVEQVEKYTGEKYNMENLTHREYFEYFKRELQKEKELEVKINRFEKDLHEKYGTMYEQVETAARNAFENMAYKDARNIIMSRMKGDIETLITFYDNIYKGLQSEKNDEKKSDKSADMLFPPKSIKGGNFAFGQQKTAGYESFI